MIKNNVKKIVIISTIVTIINLIFNINISEAQTTKNNDIDTNTMENHTTEINDEDVLSDTIKDLMLIVNSEETDKNLLEQTLDLYTQLTENYTNDEIAEMIENNKNELSTKKQENPVVNILLSANFIKIAFTVLVILFIYRTLLRCVIYKKAGKKAWAPFIPIYRNIAMLKICGMSPWWLLLLFIPIIGWAFLWVVSVASKFMLAEGFGKGTGFAFGLWLLAPIFETVLVFSKKTKYIGFED